MHPGLLLAGLFVAKKAVATSLYFAAKRYGFARVYRRILEYNKRLTPAAQQHLIRGMAKTSMRFPDKAINFVKSHEAYDFLARAAEDLKRRGGTQRIALASVVESVARSPKEWLDSILPQIKQQEPMK